MTFIVKYVIRIRLSEYALSPRTNYACIPQKAAEQSSLDRQDSV